MKKVLLTLALVITMSATAFSDTTIGDWAIESGTTQYQGTQAGVINPTGLSANGLVYSRHNLSSYGEHYQATTAVGATADGLPALTVITTEICVFCHTPHFGRVDTAPLWNRGSSATNYVPYGTTVGGTAITSVGGSSLACLSCHDGVTTLDNLINSPGKGSKGTGLGASATTGVDQGWIFGEIGASDTIGDTNPDGSKANSRLNIGAGPLGNRDKANVDLSNDHPIYVEYKGGTVASLRLASTAVNSITMDNARSNGDDATRDGFGRSDNYWASKGFITGTATIQELLRDGTGTAAKVACASCHDPHYKNQTNTDPGVVCAYIKDDPDTTTLNEATDCKSNNGVGYVNDVDSDGLFLRRVGGNSNSGVCRTCHGK